MSKATAIVMLSALFITISSASIETSQSVKVADMTLQSLEQVFSRSARAHQESMAAITRNMSLSSAVQTLGESTLSRSVVDQVTSFVSGKHLRQPKGYSGIDGARKMLNDMIYEAMSKYDQEIAKCTEYYSKQCAAMESCRGQIAASNYIAANSRALILDSQATINRCEVDIPTRKLELKQHLLKCKHELHKMNARLKIVLGDIAVMTVILKMTACQPSTLQVQRLALLRCEDPCTKRSYITFDHDKLRKQISQLQSAVSHDLFHSNFADLFSGIESLEGFEQTPIVNKTKFSNPPLPRTQVPANPCTDPNAGAPSSEDKRAAKCTITGSPQCYKLQERFLLIQAGIEDERDELMEEIAALEAYCEETKQFLAQEIADDKKMLEDAQTKLASATEKEANAGEIARQTAKDFEGLNQDLVKQMKTCSGNYINFETELCALKKIRGELYKMKGGGHSAFFQDCEVSKWDPEECTKECASGEQKLSRNILTHADGGAKCLPLAALRSCNNHPCPVDCRLAAWSGWSKCSAKCGGGVSQRLREVKLAMRYGGKPCSATSETKACNNEACEKDCELSGWTKWSDCSKDCDGGTKKRQKYVKVEPEGEGKCPDKWSLKRLQYKTCNMKRCKVPEPNKPLPCNATADVIMLMDGSGSLGKKGWKAEVAAARLFIGAFAGSGRAKMAIILYSGPRTWGGVFKCMGKRSKNVKLSQCGINIVEHFTGDFKKLDQLVVGLTWPKGSTLTSLALLTAKSELQLGRKDAKSFVVVLTDGRPLSYRKTAIASRKIRKVTRLIWVAITKYAPLKAIKRWATRRWQENVVVVKKFDDLMKAATVTQIIANMCPKPKSKIQI